MLPFLLEKVTHCPAQMINADSCIFMGYFCNICCLSDCLFLISDSTSANTQHEFRWVENATLQTQVSVDCSVF